MPPRAQARRLPLLIPALALLVLLGACASMPTVGSAPSAAPAPGWHGPEDSPAEANFAWDPAEAPEPEEADLAEGDVSAAEGDETPAEDGDDDADAVQAEEVEPDASAEPSQAPVQDLAVEDPQLSPREVKEERSVAEEAEEEITYDIPMSYNEKVLAWVDFYSNRHRERFLPGLVRSGRYLPMIRRIFAEEGIPLDLAYLAHVESAFKPNALSRAHAKGMFQFMAPTGRQYGLRQDYWIDERADPEKATRAAARYLRNLHAMFGDWHLAMAAYNAGEGRISRAMAQTGARDFWALARTSRIHRETKNYVPAILAVTLISKNPAKYGFSYVPDEPLEYDTIDVEGAVDLRVLARLSGSDSETLHTLNPALRRQQTPPDRSTAINVPRGTGETTLAALIELPPSERVIVVYHRVRRGETLSRISSRYGVSVAAIQRENKMGRKTLLRAGQTLRVPSAGAAWASAREDEPVAVARAARSHSSGTVITYKVRRGDTLTRVAARHDTTVAAVAAANGFSPRRPLRTGERIKVVPGARSSAVARKATGRSSGETTVTASAQKHTVRRGDTLWKIANRYRVSVSDLCELNDLSVGSPLFPGMRLTVSR